MPRKSLLLPWLVSMEIRYIGMLSCLFAKVHVSSENCSHELGSLSGKFQIGTFYPFSGLSTAELGDAHVGSRRVLEGPEYVIGL